MARTTEQAHTRIDLLEPRVTKIETTVHIQFKEVFARIKRLEAILIAATAAIIALLINIILTMPYDMFAGRGLLPNGLASKTSKGLLL
jgi:hypothetical protein